MGGKTFDEAEKQMNEIITNTEKEKIMQFLDELNTLTLEHGFYISTILDENGSTKCFPYLIPIDKDARYTGYDFNSDTGEIIFIEI